MTPSTKPDSAEINGTTEIILVRKDHFSPLLPLKHLLLLTGLRLRFMFWNLNHNRTRVNIMIFNALQQTVRE